MRHLREESRKVTLLVVISIINTYIINIITFQQERQILLHTARKIIMGQSAHQSYKWIVNELCKPQMFVENSGGKQRLKHFATIKEMHWLDLINK